MKNGDCDECGGWKAKCNCDFTRISESKIKFGRYKNKQFKNIPIAYLKWCYVNKVFVISNNEVHRWIEYLFF